MGTPWLWFPKYWGSIESFLERGFGFCLVFEGEVASCCLTAVIGGGEAEIQVNNFHPRFHGRGLATCIATAFVEHCLANGLRPGWTMDLRNRRSAALAQRVGFVPAGEIVGYQLDRSYQRLPEGRWGPLSE
jgi:RimJ/RimL family protein N-acetyltransferase